MAALTTLLTTAPAALAQDTSDDALLQLTARYLQDRANRVTEQAASYGALTSVEATEPFQHRLSTESAELDRLRSLWKDTASELQGAHIEIKAPQIQRSNTKAVINFVERTELHFANRTSADSPASTSYKVGHTIDFVRTSTGWELAADVLDLPQNTVDPIPYFRPVKTGDAVPSAPPAGKPVPPSLRPATPPSPGIEKPAAPPLSAAASYSRQAMADYARKWALGRNPAYESFGNDCANFVSQSLRAGGWKNVANYHNTPDAWRHLVAAAGRQLNSNTWSVSHDQLYFGWTYSGRTRNIVGEPVYLGALVYADWATAGGGVGHDGHIDHAMIVSKVTDHWDWNQIYLSYHTTDTLDISMTQLYHKGGGDAVNYYFFDLNDAA
ncbi:amidase domain-containing protein [Amycolatopsis albispora]|uniref:Putative amidase domain-containing protein n=1 Tax=Amycolatopsis albispora TaxID=1804986 RepID=A0A344L8X2_9PSEU|nr:amidase domain-containing protein [Amycolatopsis albispora]AXB44496.1 hypothetical protein A4R43_19905 [Amycolatopsis albispora]